MSGTGDGWNVDFMRLMKAAELSEAEFEKELGENDPQVELPDSLKRLQGIEIGSSDYQWLQAKSRLIDDRKDYRRADRIAQRELDEEAAGLRSAELPSGPSPSLLDFLDEDLEVEYDWVMPGRLPRGARMCFTGGEGYGKSTLQRQLLFAMALGVDPFDRDAGQTYEPQKVLYIDCENPRQLLNMRMKEAVDRWEEIVPGARQLLRENFVVELHPEGIDLSDPFYVKSFRLWAEHNEPDAVFLGPIYRTSGHPEASEEFFRSVITAVDGPRVEQGFALLTEAHVGHSLPGQPASNIRPIGSSGWKRWFEIGYYLKKDGGLTAWRPARFGNDVAWPSKLSKEVGGSVMWNRDGADRGGADTTTGTQEQESESSGETAGSAAMVWAAGVDPLLSKARAAFGTGDLTTAEFVEFMDPGFTVGSKPYKDDARLLEKLLRDGLVIKVPKAQSSKANLPGNFTIWRWAG